MDSSGLTPSNINIMSTEKQSSMMAALESNLGAVVPSLPPSPLTIIPAPEKEQIISDAEEDYKYSRKKLKSLIDKAEESLDRLIIVADETEHPRTFEVLAGMLQTTSDMTDKLMGLQKKRKDLILGKNPDEEGKQGGMTNVAVFVGTTTDLQQKLASGSDITVETS